MQQIFCTVKKTNRRIGLPGAPQQSAQGLPVPQMAGKGARQQPRLMRGARAKIQKVLLKKSAKLSFICSEIFEQAQISLAA